MFKFHVTTYAERSAAVASSAWLNEAAARRGKGWFGGFALFGALMVCFAWSFPDTG
jgi:hypothetical protein